MRLLIDFDGTIADSQRAIFELYQKEFNDYSKEYTDNHGWDFSGLIPEEHLKTALFYFTDQRFFDILEPKEGAIEALEYLSKHNEVVIVTKHHPDGIAMKAQWIRNNLPFIERVVFLNQKDMNKNLIVGDLILDDNIEALETSIAPLKVCFGYYGYNKDWNGAKVANWHELMRGLKGLD